MNKNVKVNLFGAHGDQEIDITPTGFPTRYVRTGNPIKGYRVLTVMLADEY